VSTQQPATRHVASPARVGVSDVRTDAQAGEPVQSGARPQASDDGDSIIPGAGGLTVERDRLKGGELNAAVTSALVGIHTEHLGRGPRSALGCKEPGSARLTEPNRGGPVLNRPESAAPFLNCPRCGLSIRPKTRWMTIEQCPRCLARARVAVKMFSSALPAAELYREGQAPQADARGAPTTSRSGSR
jgi:hypothetical protein